MNLGSESEGIVVGCQVEIIFTDRAGNKERLNVIIVPDDAADFSHGFLSENTPLARVLLGEKAGCVIPYLKGDILSIEVLTVTKLSTPPAKEAAEKRKAKYIETMREVEDTNAMVFASSFSGKWGDYDPDSIPKEKKSDEENQGD
jgi:hypothetical protein